MIQQSDEDFQPSFYTTKQNLHFWLSNKKKLMVNRVIAKENVCISFLIFSNASNAGLPGLTKKKNYGEGRKRKGKW